MQPASTFELIRGLAQKQRAEESADPEAYRIAREERLARDRVAAQQEWEAARADHLRGCGLAEREVAAVMTGIDPSWRAARAVEEFWADPAQQFLLVSGDPGTGKTLAAASLFLRLWMTVTDPALGERRYWLSEGAYRLAGRLADRPPFDPRTRRETDALAHRRLLVLDELGTEGVMTDPWRSVVDQVVDDRYRATGRKTVLLTNVAVGRSDNPFRERYGGRVWRRLREAGRVLSLPCIACARGPACDKHRSGK